MIGSFSDNREEISDKKRELQIENLELSNYKLKLYVALYASIVARSPQSLAYGSRYARHVSDSLRDIRRSRRVLIFNTEIRVQHWCRVRL